MSFDYKVNLWIQYPGSDREDDIEAKVKKLLVENGISVEEVCAFRIYLAHHVLPA